MQCNRRCTRTAWFRKRKGRKLKRIHWSTSPGRARRRGRVGLSTFVLVVLALALASQSAMAARVWCRTDPVLLIAGRLVDISVSGPLTAPLKVTGPTKVRVLVPRGVDADVLISDLGFGRGYDNSIHEVKHLRQTKRHTEIEVQVYVPSRDSSMPILVETSPGLLRLLSPDTAEGTANSWVTMKVKVPR